MIGSNVVYNIFTRIFVYEQGGSKKSVADFRENLLTDRCVTQVSVQYTRNLSKKWIDYCDAFDITSYDLIIGLLHSLGTI